MKASDVFHDHWPPTPAGRAGTEAPFHLRHHRGRAGFVRRHGVNRRRAGEPLGDGAGRHDGGVVECRSGPREVKIGFEILKSLGLRHRVSTSSPARPVRGGVRRGSRRSRALEKRLGTSRRRLSLSIIGCVVNGPGEGADLTDVGFTGGGAGSGMVYLAGKRAHNCRTSRGIEHYRRTGREEPRRSRRLRAAECRRPRNDRRLPRLNGGLTARSAALGPAPRAGPLAASRRARATEGGRARGRRGRAAVFWGNGEAGVAGGRFPVAGGLAGGYYARARTRSSAG